MGKHVTGIPSLLFYSDLPHYVYRGLYHESCTPMDSTDEIRNHTFLLYNCTPKIWFTVHNILGIHAPHSPIQSSPLPTSSLPPTFSEGSPDCPLNSELFVSPEPVHFGPLPLRLV